MPHPSRSGPVRACQCGSGQASWASRGRSGSSRPGRPIKLILQGRSAPAGTPGTPNWSLVGDSHCSIHFIPSIPILSTSNSTSNRVAPLTSNQLLPTPARLSLILSEWLLAVCAGHPGIAATPIVTLISTLIAIFRPSLTLTLPSHPTQPNLTHHGHRRHTTRRRPVSYTHLTLPTICSV